MLEKMEYTEKGEETCKPIDLDIPQASLVLRAFPEKKRLAFIEWLNGRGVKVKEHFMHPDGRHEYILVI